MRVLYRKRTVLKILFLFVICVVLNNFIILFTYGPDDDEDDFISADETLLNAISQEKGRGCRVPKLDPYGPQLTMYDRRRPQIKCRGIDWVTCHQDHCRIQDSILRAFKTVTCDIEEIIYTNDQHYIYGPPIRITDRDLFLLISSDHARVKCKGEDKDLLLNTTENMSWSGHITGLRSSVVQSTPPKGYRNPYNVLILGFDSTSKNGFIRKMPKSYTVLTEELGAIVMHGYNVIGDGTPAALFPILAGRTEPEMYDLRFSTARTFHPKHFIFHKLKKYGFRTAYFEDLPWFGTFQYRFKGFTSQPADHYLRHLYLSYWDKGRKYKKAGFETRYCFGSIPQYLLMLRLTERIFQQDGKKFCFTFIADITHDDFNQISSSDTDVATFLRSFKYMGHLNDTMLIVMGDHGVRFTESRHSPLGKLEERLAMMSIVLPEHFKRTNPVAVKNLEINSKLLSTPHDIYATVLDLLDLKKLWNTGKVPGADFYRGLTLFQLTPVTRSCSEAGIVPFWCSCVRWTTVPSHSFMYEKTASALLTHINKIIEPYNAFCALRQLIEIETVQFKEDDGYIDSDKTKDTELYQVVLSASPGFAIFEAFLTYYTAEEKFHILDKDISRINPITSLNAAYICFGRVERSNPDQTLCIVQTWCRLYIQHKPYLLTDLTIDKGVRLAVKQKDTVTSPTALRR